jgi:hypothetical protein
MITGLSENKLCKNCFFFIGSMPKNIPRKKICISLQKDFFILEKSDGVRYIFLLGKKKSILLDRNVSLFRLPDIYNQIPEEDGTVFDGEMSFNFLKEEYEFLIYDVISIEKDWRVSTWDLTGRCSILNKFKKKKFFNKNSFAQYIEKKDFFTIKNIQNLFKKIHINFFSYDHIFFNQNRDGNVICNKNDGIILSRSKLIFLRKSQNSIFKWKYEKSNSIDFLSIYDLNKNIVKKNFYFTTSFYCRLKKKNLFNIYEKRKIIFGCCALKYKIRNKSIEEINFNRQKGKWIFSKKRKDKILPNSNKVVQNTLENIAEAINKDEIVDRFSKQFCRINKGKLLLMKLTS